MDRYEPTLIDWYIYIPTLIDWYIRTKTDRLIYIYLD